MGTDMELTMVTMVFDSSDADALQSILAKYVVLSRGHPGCRNIDLCASATTPGRFVIVQKWESPEAQQAHFDSPDMVEMASACTGLLAHPPAIDLLETISAHDLI
ncbi:MAG TPA: antibiotic biosynthesis monooxygenase family protein [Nocardioidaceae bacterium]|jgi:quinol monooxygenase YgiN